MAEYYAVLSKAVAGLDANSPDARRAVYDKARNALIGQLKAIDPPLPTAEISRQRLELEEAIRRVERETSSVPAGSPVRVSASRPAPAEPPPPPPSARANPAPPRQSPQDVFRRAIQEAEQREETEEPRLERAPAGARIDTSWASERIDRVPPPARPSQSYLPSQGYVEEPPVAEDEPRLAPDYDYSWDQNQQADREEESAPLRADNRDRLGPKPRRAAKRAAAPPPSDEHEEIERTARPSRLPMVVLLVLILAMLGALGAFGWSQRDVIADIAGGFVSSDSGGGTAAPAAPAPSDEVAADTSGKDTDRLLVGGEQAPAGDVRVVSPGAEDDPLSAQMASTDALPLQDPGTDATAPAASIDADALVAQRGALYEEPAEAGADVFPIPAAVTWSYSEAGPNGPEIVGNVDIPDRGMKFKIAIRRNVDDTLPASHIVEVVVDAPPERAVREIPRLVFKPTEDGRGQPLIGAPAQVADGFFWIVLSGVQADVNANVNLLQDRLWIDLPFVYANGQRAILTFEKGTPGERVFERALTAWAG